MHKLRESLDKQQEALHLSDVISRTFDMSINVTQKETGEIEVKDTGGIRLHLLNEIDHKALWMYFNTRLNQYGR